MQEVESQLQHLCSQLGVNKNEIPEDIQEAILKEPDRNLRNKIFFEWYNPRTTTQEISPSDLELLRTMCTIEKSEPYLRLARRIEEYERLIDRSNMAIQDTINSILKCEKEKRAMSNKPGPDLREAVKACLASGWYKLVNVDDGLIEFKTAPVVCAYKNEALGVDMKVDLGSFVVRYKPDEGSILIEACFGNTYVGNYFHPHISREGQVCWGNVVQTYAKAMREHRPDLALEPLRLLLQSYNPESPYKTLAEFLIAKNPSVLEGEKHTISYESNWWIHDNNIPRGFEYDDEVESRRPEDSDDDDDYSERLVKVYRKKIEKYNHIVDESPYYLKKSDGTFSEVYYEDLIEEE